MTESNRTLSDSVQPALHLSITAALNRVRCKRLFGGGDHSQSFLPPNDCVIDVLKAFVILLIICTAVVAQSRDDLKKKYGLPVAETFLLRPGITVTASYDATGQVTEPVDCSTVN